MTQISTSSSSICWKERSNSLAESKTKQWLSEMLCGLSFPCCNVLTPAAWVLQIANYFSEQFKLILALGFSLMGFIPSLFAVACKLGHKCVVWGIFPSQHILLVPLIDSGTAITCVNVLKTQLFSFEVVSVTMLLRCS